MTQPPYRIGFGYDIHQTKEGRRMVLGGVEIPHSYGLDGHSDADALTHALADALLGALGLPDIGHQFPNTDPQWKDVDSQIILKAARNEITRAGYELANVDMTLIAEAPKIAPHLDTMKECLSATLGLPVNCIGLKATTNETCDDIGARKAIAAHAVALIYRK